MMKIPLRHKKLLVLLLRILRTELGETRYQAITDLLAVAYVNEIRKEKN